jgi:hypothetical protein
MQHIKDYMAKIDTIIAFQDHAKSTGKKKPMPKDTGDKTGPAAEASDLRIVAGYVRGIREARKELLNGNGK